jgi:hypothetical protein
MVWVFVWACSGVPQPVTPTAPTTSVPAVAQPTPAPSPTPEIPAPWTGPKLAASDDPVIVAEWKKAQNKRTCAAMSFAEGGDAAAGAKPRKATFAGGWAVAWDKKGLPGTDAKGNPCPTCGRSVYGIAGTGGDAANAPMDNFPFQMTFSDGSKAGYGPQSQPAGKDSFLAFLVIPGQTCLYNVWSELGQEHLELLLKNLRFVAGAP